MLTTQISKIIIHEICVGVQSTAYFNAMLGTSYTELYNPAAAKGYLLKTEGGLPYNYSYIGAS